MGESASSPATGAARSEGDQGGVPPPSANDPPRLPPDRRGGDEPTLEIPLEHARWRHLAWAVVGLAGAGFLIFDVGHAATWLGVLVALYGASAASSFVRTLLHPPGTIALRATEIALPDGLCTGAIVVVPLSEVKHAYFLRRSLPMTAASPVLVIETARGPFLYPREWFGAEGDQRRVATTLNRRLGLA